MRSFVISQYLKSFFIYFFRVSCILCNMTISNSNITFVKGGNIFFSELQTITITVNCVGVMGKGIALVAKELVPDAYKYYQKLCEGCDMNLGKPVLYNKNTNQLKTANGESKMLLLFPTKEHWKMRAYYGGIKRGLEWLIENYNYEYGNYLKKHQVHDLLFQ